MLNDLYSQTLREFEEGLGDPDGDGPLSFKEASKRDEREMYPHQAIDYLVQLGAPQLQIPVSQGGRLRSLEQLLAASYAIGRRDPSVSLSAGLQMWSQLVWMAGSDDQKQEMRTMLEQNRGVCLAASEAQHGADLLSSEFRAEWDGERYLLFGEKWPIGCATQGSVAFVLARTNAERTPRSLSWFMLGPEVLAHPGCRRLDKIPTLGMRGSDLSGLAFEGVPVGPDAVIGNTGAGLELTLKLFQVTRPLVASLSFGPGDTALRLATEFVAGRKLYGSVATELPTVRRALVRAWTDALIAEVTGIVSVRGAHVDPQGFSAGSLIAKIIVPALIKRAIDETAQVLGARFFMRDHAHGTFQKLYRDQSVISIMDGSTEVCLQALATQLPHLLQARPAGSEELLSFQCDMRRTVPELSYEQLEITSRQGNLVIGALDKLVRSTGNPGHEVAQAISEWVTVQAACLPHKVEAVKNCRNLGPFRKAEMADIALSCARLHALAVCVAFSVCNRGAHLVTERPSWLWMVARRLCEIPFEHGPPEHELIADLFPCLLTRIERRELLSALLPQGEKHE